MNFARIRMWGLFCRAKKSLMQNPQDLYGDRDTWAFLSTSAQGGKPLDGYTAEDFSMEGKKQGKQLSRQITAAVKEGNLARW
jgi:hypothetical protein